MKPKFRGGVRVLYLAHDFIDWVGNEGEDIVFSHGWILAMGGGKQYHWHKCMLWDANRSDFCVYSIRDPCLEVMTYEI